MRLRKEARTGTLGILSPVKIPTLLPIPCSLPKTQKSNREAGEIY